jgi:hypothetical protein
MAVCRAHPDLCITPFHFLTVNDSPHICRHIQTMIGLVVRHSHKKARRSAHEPVGHRAHHTDLGVGKYLIVITGTQIEGPQKLRGGVSGLGSEETGEENRDA